MGYIKVQGGTELFGSVQMPAAKNSVLPIMAASLMMNGESKIHNVPAISDVFVSMDILSLLGCKAKKQKGTVTITPRGEKLHYIPSSLMEEMRSSVFYLAPLLAKERRAQISFPGGCPIGKRPIDIHLDGLSKMGVNVELNDNIFTLTAENGITAADYTLRLPSVGATETLLMAACTAKGTTVLRGAAKEPEIQDLASFLRAGGAKITGDGTSVIKIKGTAGLYGAEYTPYGDRITAATVLCAAALCGGRVNISGVNPLHTMATLSVLSRIGCDIITRESEIIISAQGRGNLSAELKADTYPHFCTDAAPLVAAALLKANGTSAITDNIFEKRFECATGFNAMGASTSVKDRTISIKGVDALHGNAVTAPDLRGGAALVIAALAAKGESTINGVRHIKRGYEDISAMFAALGANISLHE